MARKISTMLAVAASQAAAEIVIFTGTQPGLIQQVLSGAHAGTLVHA
jgi:isopentenyl phosphate kinase